MIGENRPVLRDTVLGNQFLWDEEMTQLLRTCNILEEG